MTHHVTESYFKSGTKLGVEVLDVSGLCPGQPPPDELDPVLHPSNLTLQVGTVHAQLHCRLEPSLTTNICIYVEMLDFHPDV